MSKNIGFVSTRFAGTDGVTMESSKWAAVLRRNGHKCFWFAGQLDRIPENSFLVPEAYFKHEGNEWLNNQIFGKKSRNSAVTDSIHGLKTFLKLKLNEFIDKFKIDLLIAENALTIPMHVPLGIAITETVAETLIPTIAHHHDFYWERVRFSINAVGDYLRMAFPPRLYNLEHVVINSAAQEELALRSGISSVIIPNVLDFECPPQVDNHRTQRFRDSLGLTPGDVIILQPTRIVQRKGIEHAIDLVRELKSSRYKLVISHEAGDEGYEYAKWVKSEAGSHGVDLRIVKARIADPLNDRESCNRGLTLWDVYPHADFITYPSLYEGFGNAFLEAVYFKKPLLINRYGTFVRDIEPQGFDLAVMDGYLTKKTVKKVKEVLKSPVRRREMVDHNYEIARRYYSYTVLEQRLAAILVNFFGTNNN